MRVLGVEYKTEGISAAQLRERLPVRFGRSKITSPALLVSHNGKEEFIVDSYEIAQFLETQFSTGVKSIFVATDDITREASSLGSVYARFIEQWVDKSLAHEIRPCVIHTSYATFPTEGDEDLMRSRAYFLLRCGQARHDQLAANNSDLNWKRQQYARIRKELSIVETMLTEKGPFLAGSRPTHTDFCVFAYYVYSLTNPCMVRNTWRHPSLPFVSKWLDALFDSGLVRREELMPETIDEVPIIPENQDGIALLKPIL